MKFEKKKIAGVKNIIAVASGKGGVGKSTVAVNLAVAISKTGAKTGLIDADIYGPSIPLMFDVVDERPEVIEIEGKQKIKPVNKYGIDLLSLGFFFDSKQALIWRGPMITSSLRQLFFDSIWEGIDYMVIDLPPGTGDAHLTLLQELVVDGVVIVSTPQEVALIDARKALSMFTQQQLGVPVLGLIENMSYFIPPDMPDKKYYIFGKEGCQKLAVDYNIDLLGQIPIVENIRESGDIGKPVALSDKTVEAIAFRDAAKNVIKKLEAGR
jgi:ATP-binding protein involved in chromosome partitioning